MNAYIKDDNVHTSGVRLINGNHRASKLAAQLVPHLDSKLISIDQLLLDKGVLKLTSGYGLFKVDSSEEPPQDDLLLELVVEGVNTSTPLYGLRIMTTEKTLSMWLTRDFIKIEESLKSLSNEGLYTNSGELKFTLVEWLAPAPLKAQKTLLHLLKEDIPLSASFEEVDQVKVTFL